VYELLTNSAYYVKSEVYTKAETNTQVSTSLPLAGGTMTGNLQIYKAEPIINLRRSDNALLPGLLWQGSGGAQAASIRMDGDSGTANSLVMSTFNGSSVAERLRILTGAADGIQVTGNVGIGVTPETDWHSGKEAIQLGVGASIYGDTTATGNQISANARSTLGSSLNGYKYISTDKASTYHQYDGAHNFRVAASGSADAAISWNTAMTIDNNGAVGIGTTTPTSPNWGSAGANKELAIDGTTGYGVLHLRGTGSGSTNTKFSIGVGDDNLYLAYDEVDSAHRIIVDGTGAVTMPTQPAFQASKSSSTAVANATWVTLVFNNERFDNNADYNPSTGVFTAPITGKYQMNFSARIDNIPHTAAHASVQFNSSNTNYMYQSLITPTSYDSTLNYITFHASSLIDMDTGDTVKCDAYIQNGTGTHVAYTGNIFSGYLVC
jgi:hypothetical protein